MVPLSKQVMKDDLRCSFNVLWQPGRFGGMAMWVLWLSVAEKPESERDHEGNVFKQQGIGNLWGKGAKNPSNEWITISLGMRSVA